MRRAAMICLFLAAALGGFAWWGMSTPDGTRRLDEAVPFAAGVVSALLAMCGIITFGFSRIRRP
ncbi:hypothetical protein [Roseococcus sp.]|uniref:hypothetical protein n=1 Tax=Roseococcus sp. TaxID=2109646 RepID=UPI003BAC8022